jgi:hypothetical protein
MVIKILHPEPVRIDLKCQKKFQIFFLNMCKTWGRVRIRIIINIESRIRNRLVIKPMPIHNTGFRVPVCLG